MKVRGALCFLVACGGAVPAPSAPAHVERAACAWSGRAVLTEPLADGATVVAKPTGAEMELAVTAVDGERVRVAAKPVGGGPSLTLFGWMPASSLELRVVRDVAIAPGHVWIASGAPVRIIRGLRVQPSTEARFDAAADVACADLAIGHGADDLRTGAFDHAWRWSTKALDLYDAPSGAKIVALAAGLHDTARVEHDAERDGFVHVRIRDRGLRVEGWVPSHELARDEPADCDDCGDAVLDKDDVCFGSVSDADQCVPHGETLVVFTVAAPVRLAPRGDAPVVGRADAGARAWRTTKSRPGWASVRLEHAELVPPEGGDFWVPDGALAAAQGLAESSDMKNAARKMPSGSVN